MDLTNRVKALNAERLKVVEEARALVEETTGRARTAEETQKLARMDARIDELGEEVSELVAREERSKEAGELHERSLSVFGEAAVVRSEKTAKDAFRAWLKAPKGSELRSAEFEIDIQRAIAERQLLRQGADVNELRALAWDATSGSLVVPTTMARTIFDLLEANIAAFQVGASVLTTSSGENMLLPKLLAHGVATQVSGQGTTLAGTDPTFSRTALNVYKYAELVKVSNELLADSAFNVESWLGGDLGYALARVIDADLVVGTGTGEPTGMTVLAGAGTNAPVTTGGSLIAPTVEKFIDLQYSIPDSIPNPKWLMKNSVAGTIRKLRDGAGGTVGAFLWEPSLTAGLKNGQPDRFLGAPVYMDTNCAAAGSAAVLATYGGFDQYVIRTVGNPAVERSDEAGFTTDEAFFRGKWRVGGNHRQVGYLNNLVQNV